MKQLLQTLAILTVICLTISDLLGAERYVSLAGGHDTAGGYTNWVGAATTIQAAVDVSIDGDWIWVSNGVYEVGVTYTSGAGSNRVLISKSITVASWNNDREQTIIKGGEGVRPVYMSANSKLIGFTITNGNMSGSSGGGIRCSSSLPVISNCVIVGNTCSGNGGGVQGGSCYDCDIIGNTAGHGAGVTSLAGGITYIYRCNIINNHAENYAGGVRASYVFDSHIVSNTAVLGGGGGYAGGKDVYMTNCVLSYNSSDMGGGVYQYNLYGCKLYGNSARLGGGADSYNLYDCQVYSNRAGEGGGIYRSFAINCVIAHNYATNSGGGIYLHAIDSMTNCLVVGNEAGTETSGQAAGIWGNTGANIYNCTVTGNKSQSFAGVRHVNVFNTIIWGNLSGVGAESGSFTDYYSCGVGFSGEGSLNNIDPQFFDPGTGYGINHVIGDYRLQRASPCINAGTNQDWMIDAVDLDGHRRIDQVWRRADMGAYEIIPAISIFRFK